MPIIGDMSKLILVLLCLVMPATALAAQHDLQLYSEVASFNKGYRDLRFRDNNSMSFAVPMTNLGTEYQYKNDRREMLGFGLVQTVINAGEKENESRTEKQALTLLTVPYSFVGRDFGFYSLALGVSYYFFFERFPERYYRTSDGSTVKDRDSEIDLNRQNSLVFVNFMARIFPEDFLHFKVRIGRERFSITDSLINFSFVAPLQKHLFEVTVSLFHPMNWFGNTWGSPVSNQRVSFAYSRYFSILRAGIESGILLNNRFGGGGTIPFFNRLSFGLFAVVSL